MKKRSTLFSLLGLVFVLTLILVACGNEESPGEAGGDTPENGGTVDITPGVRPDIPWQSGEAPAHIQEILQTEMPVVEDVIEGGILQVGISSSSPIAGMFHPLWSSAATDTRVMDFFGGAMLTSELGTFLMDLGEDARGAAIPEISEDGKTVYFTIRDNVYWHDGYPVTARDWLFAYEVMASQEYAEGGFGRFGQQNERSIVGIMDFHNGDADYIAGIEILGERKISFTYEDVVPIRNTYFMRPLPYHLFGDIPIADMPDSPYARAGAIGFGPFIMDVVVPGESVTFVRNENFWDGAPYLEGVTLRVISPETLGHEFAAGNLDVADTFREADMPYFGDLSNVTYLKNIGFVYNYVGFRLGHWDADLGESVLDPDATMADVNLRKAMWMAIDGNLLGTAWFDSLRWEATSLIPPAFTDFHDASIGRPVHDMDLANALLDYAGFAFVGDYRANPDGSPLEINFFVATGDSIAEAVNNYHLNQFRALGLNVTLHEYEFSALGSLFDTDVDDDRIDVFLGAWSTGTNPSPYGLYGRSSGWNRSRYVSERNDELLARIDSAEGVLDPAYRAEAFREWQAYQAEVIQFFPTMYRFAFIPVNNRVTNFEISTTFNPIDGWHNVRLTHDAPLAD